MYPDIISWFRGLWILRDPILVRDLGERRFHLHRIREIESKHVGCRIDPNIQLISYRSDRLHLESNATISAGTIVAFGDEHNGFGSISVGERTWIGQYNNLRAGGGDICIGRDCLISQFCTIVASHHATSLHAPINTQPPQPHRHSVKIQDDVWLGAGAVITAGVTIGKGAIIGAGSVVTRDVPDCEIWAGVPAGKIRQRS